MENCRTGGALKLHLDLCNIELEIPMASGVCYYFRLQCTLLVQTIFLKRSHLRLSISTNC